MVDIALKSLNEKISEENYKMKKDLNRMSKHLPDKPEPTRKKLKTKSISTPANRNNKQKKYNSSFSVSGSPPKS